MLSISFDFDEQTQKVSNLKVTSTEKKNTVKNTVSGTYALEVCDNKLQLTDDAITKLNAVAGDRIAVNYWNESPTETYPIISKSEIFTDGADGTKLTKSKTISFRGQQRTTLLKFGSMFNFEEFIDKTGEVKDGVFKLIPVKVEDDADSESIKEEEASFEAMDQSKVEDDMAEMLKEDEDTYDDLPF